MPNAILLQLGFDEDPDGRQMYNHVYMRRQAIKHLCMNWKALGKEIIKDVTMQYGRPDSEINGRLIAKEVVVKGKKVKKYGFSVMQLMEYILKERFWCDEIFLKLVASMWSCRITVIRSDSLKTVDYRHALFWSCSDIILMYNCCPFQGHYSAVIKCMDDGEYQVCSIEPVKFTAHYRKHVDLDERLKRNEEPWDLDRERFIFTKKRGYKYAKEDKEDAQERKKKENEGGSVEKTIVGEDEMVVKKEEWKKMEDEMKKLKEEVKQIDGLKKEVDRLKGLVDEGGQGEAGKVVVEEKSMETLRDDLDTLKRKFDDVLEGTAIEPSSTENPVTPQKKSRAHNPDKPPDAEISKIVRKKRVEVRREVADNLPEIDKSTSVCPVCKEDYITQPALVAHYSKFHKNEYLYHCAECGKGFMSILGYNLHKPAHQKNLRLNCEDPDCKKTFGSKSAVKKHMREQHPTEEEKKAMANIKCQYCEKKFKTKANRSEHELGCVGNKDREELTCEVCDLGGFYVAKRVLAHKRTCHGWEG